jgi:hypothetical protein
VKGDEVIAAPGEVTHEQVSELRELGYSDEQISEVVGLDGAGLEVEVHGAGQVSLVEVLGAERLDERDVGAGVE